MSKNRILLMFFLLFLLFFSISISQQEEFISYGFAGGGSINVSLNGVAEIEESGILRLTNNTGRIIGRAFYPQPLRFKNSEGAGEVFSFSTAFAFAIVPNPEYPTFGGHGIAFVLYPNREFPGALPSQYLGLLNSSDNGNATDHLLAVEFDTVMDFEFRDINDNHVGVDIDSLISSKSAAVAYFDADSGAQQPLNLKSGRTIQAWIDYDGTAKVLNVTLSPFSTKPISPLLSVPADLSQILHDEMFVGFSASTGLLTSTHYLLGWSFKMNGMAQSLDLSSLSTLSELSKPKKKNSKFTAIIATLSTTVIVVMAALLAAYRFYCSKNAELIEPWELEQGPHRFSYNELNRATKGFGDRELLGFGGFGKVYKGVLPSSGAEIAVKRISHDSRQGIREFVAEIGSIGRLRHRHLVQLQGWCRRKGDLLLVYDYMPNGSLDRFLFSNGAAPPPPPISWVQRFRILRGVASALLYLHEEWEHVVIHRDVKASNVLLDANLDGRLGDFGLAKLQEHGANPGTTRVVGTLGYLAPELTRTGKATTSTDVYAYGALILEVVCGRRPIEPKAMPEELILVDWVWELWAQGRWTEIVDPRLIHDGYDVEEAELAVKIGLLCSQPVAAIRPTMREVARYLDICNVAEVPDVPPLPPLFSSPYAAAASEKARRGETGEDFVHSYPSSCSDKVSGASLATGWGDGRRSGTRGLLPGSMPSTESAEIYELNDS
ncbi:hypothetical protein KFK09_021585 [Dendrobium nobile]|uniref:non-specific serine/threonine protein kinase n=1 Tax=Dendrobium nobile TaxID=94219 RepID=A0A8T3AQR6_DENNO|nr:hypothetical protein KFK09_021585 [Dendrobium nobile]